MTQTLENATVINLVKITKKKKNPFSTVIKNIAFSLINLRVVLYFRWIQCVFIETHRSTDSKIHLRATLLSISTLLLIFINSQLYSFIVDSCLNPKGAQLHNDCALNLFCFLFISFGLLLFKQTLRICIVCSNAYLLYL
jgi:hypothetical protein